MRLTYEFCIDGHPLPVPDMDVTYTENDLHSDDSGRDESGWMHLTVVRERVKTWDFTYFSLDNETFRYIKSLFAGKSSFTFRYRGDDGQPASCEAYNSKIEIKIHNIKKGQYRDLSFSIIER